MDALFQELIATLQQAREAVSHELGLLAGQDVDHPTLHRLPETGRSFAEQADSLVLMMIERQTDDNLVQVAYDLADFFRGVEERIEPELAIGRKLG